MIGTRRAEKRAFVVGLVVAVVACGSAAAAVTPVYSLDLHARLAPVSGTTASGQFTGTLVMSVGETDPGATSGTPVSADRAVLMWKLNLPVLHGSMSAWLRLPATNNAAPFAQMLCGHCSTTAAGRITLATSQGFRIARSDAVVVVNTASAKLRGPVKVSARIVPQSAR